MDRIDTMNAFVSVVTEGSFARAAERLEISPQLVSKYVSQLEEHLGTRLLNRTTRKVSVTEAGTAYFQRAQQVLSDIEDMENELGDLQHSVRGLLRINAPVSFAIQHMASVLTDYRAAFPEVQVDLQLNDRKVDIVQEGFDIALRIGQLKSSSLIARRIAPVRLSICASPDYLARQGIPSHPDELKQHQYLRYSYMDNETSFRDRKRNLPLTTTLHSDFSANNGDVLLNAAIAGAGVIIQPTFITGPAIASGQLQSILQDFEPEPLGLYAVYAHRQFLSAKVRSFIDFIGGYFGDPPYWDDFRG
ncbi:MAG: LysR family transcriptional regulator [Pseudomonadota bacterium]|nr:LysR family transcriptional regulator [Pseudomonadota bacterium]